MRSSAQPAAGHAAPPAGAPRIRCRPVEDSDIAAVVNLLTGGFRYSRKSWQRAFARLAQHATPAGYPRYGYLLESAGAVVGLMPMIFATIAAADGATTIRCSVSNWYVAPAFRAYAALLASHALRHREVTYFVVTPAPHTLALLEAQGYTRYCRGRFVAVPALCGGAEPVRIAPVAAAGPIDGLEAAEAALLQAHARLGCYSLVCHAGGAAHPFVFATRRKFGVVPFAALIYCRELGDFVRFAGPLGRFLACRGFPLVVIDADGPIAGLAGRYADGYPKYFKGPDRPRLGDLAYSKRVFFGI